MWQPNKRIGPYTLIRLLETHGLDEIWLVERHGTTSSGQVALKFLARQNRGVDEAKREARIWAQASGHPKILSFIEADLYDGLFVIAIEHTSAHSLSQLLSERERKPLHYNLTGNIILGILAGLEHLHAQKIIHRDLKPANVYLRGDTPCLAGFGLACILETTKESDRLVGTPAYMSPEAWYGKFSAQTDLWSVAVLFYELLTGNLPFLPQTDITSLAAVVLISDPAPLSSVIPVQLREIIIRGLNKDTTHRYNTATEMRTALQEAMVGAA
jgi:serine/threonine protein kinase